MARRLFLSLLATTAVVAGCGGGDAATDAVGDRMERAAQRASEVDDFELEGSMRSTFRQARFALSGTFVQTSDSARMLVEDGDFETGGRRFKADLLNVGDDYYFRGGPFDRLLPPGKRWLHSTEGGPTLSMAQLFMLLGDVRDVREVGAEPIGGRPTDHFQASLGVNALAQALGGSPPEEFADGTATDAFSIRLDIWLDEADDVRRMDMEATIEGTPQRLDASFVVTDYDTRTEIEPPPAAQVAELPE